MDPILLLLHVAPALQVGKGGPEVAEHPVGRGAHHELVGLLLIRRDLAAVEVGREGHVPLPGESARLVLHPVVEPPPLLDHDDGGERPLPLWSGEEAGSVLVAALEGDGFLRRPRRPRGHEKDERQSESQDHDRASPSSCRSGISARPGAAPRWPPATAPAPRAGAGRRRRSRAARRPRSRPRTRSLRSRSRRSAGRCRERS